MSKYLCEEDMTTGEYISRDEALKAMQYCCENCDNYNGAMCRACDNADEMDIICDIHTADVQPVKRGEWVYSDIPIFGNPYGRYCCSLCGSAMDSGTDNYCPCCGANMRGDVEIARIDK